MTNDISPETLYRLPWNLADNPISWLEPTSQCNLSCDGCYRENRSGSHKSLEEIQNELDVFKRLRKTDSISIAGGEPLAHPNIVEIVRLVKKMGWKPIINSNGGLLTREILKELKTAGVFGFTFHIDSYQHRPGWKNSNEIELCELRYEFARMLADVKGISCSFNSTVYPETVQYVPELLKWSQKHIDIVHIMVFILYRMAILEKDYDYYLGGKQISLNNFASTTTDDSRRVDLTSPELVEEIRKVYPDFKPNSFLNGTSKPDSYKWLCTTRLGNKHEIFGYFGPKFMEAYQSFKHFTMGRYVGYEKPYSLKMAGLTFLLSFMDKGIREAAKKYFRSFSLNPKAFFNLVYSQSVMIIQPIDFMSNGNENMCDGCPDMTVWNDKLVWSCRLEEQLHFGENLRTVSKSYDR